MDDQAKATKDQGGVAFDHNLASHSGGLLGLLICKNGSDESDGSDG